MYIQRLDVGLQPTLMIVLPDCDVSLQYSLTIRPNDWM